MLFDQRSPLDQISLTTVTTDEARQTSRFMTRQSFVGMYQKILCRNGTTRVERKIFFFHFHVYAKFRENASAKTELRKIAFTKKRQAGWWVRAEASIFTTAQSALSFLGCSVAQLSVQRCSVFSALACCMLYGRPEFESRFGTSGRFFSLSNMQLRNGERLRRMEMDDCD